MKDSSKNEENTEIFDIEAMSKEGKTPPPGKKYMIKVDNKTYVVPQKLSGREILETAGKNPYDRFQLNLKLRGGIVKKIGYAEIVDFTQPGIEKFMTIPLDQTEG
ncbi:MAG: multiubiquitin domain-containing protein [Bacteroidetes bacterium]|nr:multiubiquitin domain-containing protein [Bacteroidota bacterium]